jgi:translation initiation factor 5B
VATLGHVDHGKTLILDRIRGTAVAAGEVGEITQHIGASFIPHEVIKTKCKGLLDKYGFKLDIPGLLFIDTPGHAVFTNMRKRGGNAADLAVLVIDITQGVQPQTIESIEILKHFKTPFIIAANKIDLLDGWIKNKDACFLETFEKQQNFVKERLDEKIYALIGQLGKYEFNAERFDRINDLTKEIVIVPVSAKSGEGIVELLMFLAGLSQRFMEQKLHVSAESPAKGSVLEVKKVEGLGVTIDAVIYEGNIKVNDKIAVATPDTVLITKVRALLQPAPLEEIRDPRKKFKSIEKIYAASGLKISAPGLENVIAGSPILVVEDEKKAKEEIMKEIKRVKIEKDVNGAVLKADALGSLEAVVELFGDTKIQVRKADVGAVTKKDLAEAEAVKKENRYLGVIFAFNVKVPPEIKTEAENKGIMIFESDVVYRLQEFYEKWKKEEKEREKQEKLGGYIYPAKIKILPGCIFRASKPAIVGVEVLAGIIKSGYPLMTSDGKIQNMQEKNKTVEKAEKGVQVAVSIDKATVGRQITEGQVLFTCVPIKQLYELEKGFDDKELLHEIMEIKAKTE